MSETGTLVLEPVSDPATQRNFERLTAQRVGRAPAQARVYNSANITTTTGVSKVLTFDSERWDTGACHSSSSNTDRLTAPTAGLYSIGGCVRFAANGTGFRQVEVLLTPISGSGTVVIDSVVYPVVAAGIVPDLNPSTEYQMAAGDYVTLRATQNSGGNLNIVAQLNQSPEFWIHRIGSQA